MLVNRPNKCRNTPFSGCWLRRIHRPNDAREATVLALLFTTGPVLFNGKALVDQRRKEFVAEIDFDKERADRVRSWFPSQLNSKIRDKSPGAAVGCGIRCGVAPG